MEINIPNWKTGISYEVDDIVRVPHFYSMTKNQSKDITVNQSDDIYFQKISIQQRIGYEASVSVRKISQETGLKDNFTTHINTFGDKSSYNINKSDSVGLGVGFVFYDQDENIINIKDPRKFTRLSAGSEFHHEEYKKIFIELEDMDIPEEAQYIGIFIFAYGLRQGGYKFIEAKLSPASHFFYCTKNHVSAESDGRDFTAIANLDKEYWTQDFVWRPSYSSRASFLARNENMDMGEGNDHILSAGINSLPMQIDVKFDNRTDKQSRAIIHFLQEKHFAYESMFSLDYRGDRLKSNEVKHFNFEYTFPYKELKFTCTEFTHNIKYRNNNEVSAVFVCNHVPIMDSAEGSDGYNDKEDAIFPCGINGRKFFSKDRVTRLDTFALPVNEQGVIPNDLERVSKQFEGVFIKENDSFLAEIGFMSEDYKDPENQNIENKRLTIDEEVVNRLITDMQWWNFSINLKFKDDKPQNLKAGDWIYLSSNLESESIFSVGISKIRKVISDTEFVTDGIRYEGFEDLDFNDIVVKNNGYEGELPDITFTRLERHPDDCLASKVTFPGGVQTISSMVLDKRTGLMKKRKIISRDYRTFYLERDVKEGDTYIYLSSDNDYSVVGPIGFDVLVPMIRGKTSMYIDDPDSVLEYPWSHLRNFDYMPTMAFTMSNTPKYLQTDFIKYYDKKYKKTINSNLAQINITFEQRSDEEARAILLFLESHLGYKKFSLDLPRPYLIGSDNNIPEEIIGNHVFYCPSWSHEIVYKNNHKITATFFESKSGDVYGNDSAATDGTCKVGGTITDLVTQHKICTYSSSSSAYAQGGLMVKHNLKGEPYHSLDLKGKEVDIVFVIDGGPSLLEEKIEIGDKTYRKYDLFIDSIMKMVVGYDGNQYPGTFGLQKEEPAMKVDFDQTGSQNIPPWYAYQNPQYELFEDQIRSLIYGEPDRTGGLYEYDLTQGKILNQDLTNEGYDNSQFKRFNIEIEERRVNIGISIVGNSIMSEYPMDRFEIQKPDGGTDYIHKRILDLPDFPRSFDKIEIWRALRKHLYEKDGYVKNNELGRNHAYALQDAMAQLYNSPRANIVDERYIFYISDFYFDKIDKGLIKNISSAMKNGGPLAKRRPRDVVLEEYGIDRFIQKYAYSKSWRVEGEDAYSNLINPDFSDGGMYSSVNYINYLRRVYLEADVNMSEIDALQEARQVYNSIGEENKTNPDWYKDEIKTTFIPIAAGVSGEVDDEFEEYAGDYNPATLNEDLQYLYTTNLEGDPREEAFRIFNLTNVVRSLSKDSGVQNLFSITVNNCGPHPIRLKNSILSFESEEGQAKWTTDILESGIPRNNDTDNFSYIKPSNNKLNPMLGTGGQYFGDPLNKKLLSNRSSNMIWHNFNTRYEVYRKGELMEVDGGWNQKVLDSSVDLDLIYSDTGYGQSELYEAAKKGDQSVSIKIQIKEVNNEYKFPVDGYFLPGNKVTIGGDEYIIKNLNKEDIIRDCRYQIFGACIGIYNAAYTLELTGLLRKNYDENSEVLESSPVRDMLATEDGFDIVLSDSGVSMQDLITQSKLDEVQEEGLDISSLKFTTRTKGVENDGVAFKGMPIRVFHSELAPLEIIDYNIGGVDKESETPDGNYEHLPVLNRGESIDLFFGVRCNDLQSYEDKIQIVINSEQVNEQNPNDIYLDCYADTQIAISVDKNRVFSSITQTGGDEEEHYNEDEEKKKAEHDLVAAQAPIIEQIVPSVDGLCDPYGVIEPLVNNFAKMHLEDQDIPAWAIIWQALYDGQDHNYQDYNTIFDLYRPFGGNFPLAVKTGAAPFMEKTHGGRRYYEKTFLDKLVSAFGLSVFFGRGDPMPNRPIGDADHGVWGLEEWQNFLSSEFVYLRTTEEVEKRDKYGIDKYKRIKPNNIYNPERHELGGFPTWWPEFLENLKGQGNHKSPWEVQYRYGTIKRFGGGRTYSWIGLPYNEISNLQQFFDCMFMEVVWWQLMMGIGLPWNKGARYYGEKTSGGNSFNSNLDSLGKATSWPMEGSKTRCRFRVYKKCCGRFTSSWGYRTLFHYKHSIFHWMMEKGWGGGNICPGGPNHENSIFYKQNKPDIIRNLEYQSGSVFLSSKAVMSEEDKKVDDKFWASVPGKRNSEDQVEWDVGQYPEHKFFGPWASYLDVDKSNPTGTNIIEKSICDYFLNACKFSSYKVPYDHLKTIMTDAPIRVTIYGPRRPEDCNCGSLIESKTLAESQDLYQYANVIFDGIGPFVLNSLKSIDGFEDWFHSAYESSEENEKFWYENFNIKSGKQFLGCYGLEDATTISITWLGTEYVDFDRQNNKYNIKKLPNDFCYNEIGERVDCYKISQLNSAAAGGGYTIINELKRGSIVRSEVDFSAGEVQYGKTYGNDYSINNKIYPGAEVPAPQLSIDELNKLEELKREEVAYAGLLQEGVDLYEKATGLEGAAEEVSNLGCQLLFGGLFGLYYTNDEETGELARSDTGFEWNNLKDILEQYKKEITDTDLAPSVMYDQAFNQQKDKTKYKAQDFYEELMHQIQLIEEMSEDNLERIRIADEEMYIREEDVQIDPDSLETQNVDHFNIMFDMGKKFIEIKQSVADSILDPDAEYNPEEDFCGE